MLEKLFHVTQKGSDFRTELLAGLTTFMTMAYILMVNSGMFAELPGVSYYAIYIATALSAAIGTILIGLLANIPLAQASAMGSNAFFVYTVCLGFGLSYANALVLILLDGIAFIILTVTGLRRKIFEAIPTAVRLTIPAGVGLFIAFIGLLNVGLISISGAVPALQLSMLVDGQRVWNTQGLLTLVGLLITAILMTFRVKGAVVIGILVTTLLGLPAGVTQIPESVTMEHVTLAPVFFQLDLGGVFSKGLLPLLTAMISFAIVDCFDTLGALVGLSSSAGLEDHDGRADRALIADAMATCCGACIGTSTVTTFAESSTGIAEGARTGFSSMVVGVLFLFSVFLAPVAGIIPAAATAPALIIVGVLTMRSAVFIPWEDAECAVPAFLTIAVMPFAYSISDGIAFGFISYSLIKLIQGKGREVSLLTYGISLVFILKYLLGNMV